MQILSNPEIFMSQISLFSLQARVFGQSFLMSGVNVVIDDDGDSAATERARWETCCRFNLYR